MRLPATAARAGARVCALDLTPALLEHARDNAALAVVAVEFLECDVVVLSQFGHIFALRPDVAVAQMLRVLNVSKGPRP